MDTLLINLPLMASCKNFQRCYVGPEVMKKLRLKIKSVVVVAQENEEFICTTWPRSDQKEGFIQVDTSVSLTFDSFIRHRVVKTNSERKNYNIRPIENVKRLSQLDVRLLTNESSDSCNFTNYISQLQTILENVLVKKGCVVSMAQFQPLSQQLGISAIIVENYTIESSGSSSADGDQSIGCHGISSDGDQSVGCHGISSDGDRSVRHHGISGDGDRSIGCHGDPPATLDVNTSGRSTDSSSFECGIVTQRTKIKILDYTTLEKQVLSVKRSRQPVGALSKELNFLKDLIDGCFSQKETFKRIGITVPKGILLHGPPGVGKTLLVRSVSEDCGAVIIVVNGSEVFGPHPGESEENLRRAFQEAQKRASEGAVILFIDELDALCPKRGMDSGSHENRVVAQLLTLMDGVEGKHDFVVIGATNRPNAIDPALRRPGRFDREIVISVPSKEQRKAILLVHTKDLQLSPNVKLENVAELTNGYVGADLASLCREASFQALRRINLSAGLQKSKPVVSWEDFQQALGSITPSTQRQTNWKVDLRPVSWDEIGGLEDVKSKLKQDLEWPLQHAASFSKLGIQTPRGVLLYGPPGCCKTTLVRAAATSCNATFFSVSGAQLFSPYVGDSEKAIAEIFHHARLGAPSIIFFDEIDSIIGNRSQGGKKGVQQRVLSTLLTEMDGLGVSIQDRVGSNDKICEGEESEFDREKLVKRIEMNKNVIVVAATNRPELIDSAIMRPGRLDRVVYVPPPDYQARLGILKVYTKNMPQDDQLNLEQIAKEASLYSGADLENLCREAALIALQQDGLGVNGVKQAHFEAALQATKPSLSTGQIDTYSEFANGIS